MHNIFSTNILSAAHAQKHKKKHFNIRQDDQGVGNNQTISSAILTLALSKVPMVEGIEGSP